MDGRPVLFIATNNRGKQAEFRALLTALPVQLRFPQDAPAQVMVEERGSTYAENAALKARAWAQATGWLTLADDSGLEVDALGGEPGIRSARYAPWPGATDADRRRYLLQRLAAHPRPWTARFRCVLAVVTPNGELHLVEGVCEGEIVPTERGTHGFGYDPIFYLPERGCTMAELTPDEKNRVSHRARAVQAALPLLQTLLAVEG